MTGEKSKSNDCFNAVMDGFPYKQQIEKVIIHKKEQRRTMWKQLFNPREFCSDMKKDEILWKVLFWLGIVFAFFAIIVGLIKELDEGKVDEDMILRLSLIELTLAIISVIVSITKHFIKYNAIIKLQKHIVSASKQSIKSGRLLSTRAKVLIATCGGWMTFVLIIVIGFVTLHFKDDSTNIDLLYTKYTTTLTLFFVLALDGVVNDVLGDAHEIAQCDQYKLVLHQVLLELKKHLREKNEIDRISELESFFDRSELCSIKDLTHFVFMNEKIEITTEVQDIDSVTLNKKREDNETFTLGTIYDD